MSVKCCFKFCKSGPLSIDSARVEIKSAVPKTGLGKHDGNLLVLWKNNGEAVFHTDCWTTLLGLSRKRYSGHRKRKQHNNEEVVMFQNEKVMIKEANKTVERFDSVDNIKKFAHKTAEMLLKAKHCVFFTGAGISTSAGLGDFRGKGGKWTEQDREAVDIDGLFQRSEETTNSASPAKKPRSESMSASSSTMSSSNSKDWAADTTEKEEEEEDVMYENLRPTFTHEAIAQLMQTGYLKYLISQNCDGLHLLAGVTPDFISELHGNVFVEKCEVCGKQYQRSYYVCDDVSDLYLEELTDHGKTDIVKPKFMKKCKTCGLSHRTGRRCEEKQCSGYLMDTIINFGDNLEENILDKAFEAADACDLMVCLGSTLTVTPANELVDYVRNPRRIVICNRQPTEKDDACEEKDGNGEPLGVRVFGDCDVFMKFLMAKLLDKKQHDCFEKSLRSKALAYDDLRPLPSNDS